MTPAPPAPPIQLPVRSNRVPLEGPKVHHIPSWGMLSDPQRLKIIRSIAMQRGRDPRITALVLQIIKAAGVQPRDYKGQAAALLKWVQNPKNIYYINEPGERLQDPLYTLKLKHADCLPEGTLVLRDDYALIPLRDLQAGMKIWGLDKWTKVQDVWATGEKQITELVLNNGCTLKATENHRIFVWACSVHGPGCLDFTERRGNCKNRPKQVQEIRVADVKPGYRLVRPDQIKAGKVQQDPDRALIEGLYTADGWVSHKYEKADGEAGAYDFSIAGKDGHPKEAQKKRVQAICEKLSIKTYWHERYITIIDRVWAKRLIDFGTHAPEKQIPSIDLKLPAAAALLEGMMADSGLARSGCTVFSTTSRILALQARILFKMQGIHTSMMCVENHGGLGTHPIYRMSPYKGKTKVGTYSLQVKEIHRARSSASCYDLTTEDHYVYLPESDTVVHNCDDMAILLCTFFEAIKLDWKLVLSGQQRGTKAKRRFVEGSVAPANVDWSHIYCAVGTPPFRPTTWYFCEPTVQNVPLGWDVIDGDHSLLPEMGGTGKPAVKNRKRLSRWGGGISSSIASAVTTELEDESTPTGTTAKTGFWAEVRKIMPAIMSGVAVGVTTQLLLDDVRAWRDDARKQKKDRSEVK